MNEGFPKATPSQDAAPKQPSPEILEKMRESAGVGEGAAPAKIAEAFNDHYAKQGVDPIDALPQDLDRDQAQEVMRWLDAA